jgi:hypothetical protein
MKLALIVVGLLATTGIVHAALSVRQREPKSPA